MTISPTKLRTRTKTDRSSAAKASQHRTVRSNTANGRKTRAAAISTSPPPTKLQTLITLLSRAGGSTIEELSQATGWQAHSVRGALAGALKRKGHVIRSQKKDGVRRYVIEADE